jgi:hypothetical protein
MQAITHGYKRYVSVRHNQKIKMPNKMGNRKVLDLHEEAAGADLEVVAEGAGYKTRIRSDSHFNPPALRVLGIGRVAYLLV